MDRSRSWVGILLVVLGILFLLDSLDYVDFGDVIRIGWPLILIALGLRVILGRRRNPDPIPAWHTPGSSDMRTAADMVDQSTVFGSLNLHVDSQAFAGGAASTVFGEVNIDLGAVTLREGQSLLKLNGVFGAIHVRLPRLGAAYAVALNAVLGDVVADEQHQDGFSPSLRYQSPGYGEAQRRIMITASVVFGEITVRSM